MKKDTFLLLSQKVKGEGQSDTFCPHFIVNHLLKKCTI